MGSYIRDNGPSIARDYPVCAIKPGTKQPYGMNWQNNPLSPEQCETYSPSDYGVGILTGVGDNPLYGIDVDVPGDATCAKAIYAMLQEEIQPELLRREGNPPKFLVPVIGAEAGWPKKMTPFYEKDGIKARIEILGKGNQFVALAIHPDTHKPYTWHGDPVCGDYIDSPEFMPVVDAAKIERIMSLSEEILRQHGWELENISENHPQEATSVVTAASDIDLTPQYPMNAKPEEVAEWLKDLPGKDNRNVWIDVGMALHFEFGSRDPDVGLKLWDDWSKDSPKYKGYEDLVKSWNSFKEHKNGRMMKTCRWIYAEYKKRHPGIASVWTEAGYGARFAEYYGKQMLYASDIGKWFEWDGIRWKRLSAEDAEWRGRVLLSQVLEDDVIKALQSTTDEAERSRINRFYKSMQLSNKPVTIITEARRCPVFRCNSTDFDAKPRFFGVKNGVIDLEDCSFRTPDRSMMISMTAGTDYVPDAKCPTWEQTVSEVFFGDQGMVDYVQRFFGYALTGEPNREVMGIFHGNGCNGKSTIVNVLRDLFGEYGHTASCDLVTTLGKSSTNAGGARSDIIALRGKRLVVISEIDQRARMQEHMVKSLVSCDEVTARGLYQAEESTFRPSWVVTMLTNHMPYIEGTDEGIWRRIHAVPFDRNFDKDDTVKKDVYRAAKLREEMPGILNWLLEGVKKFRDRKLEQPDKVKKESAEYKTSMDYIGEWLTDRCEFNPDYLVRTEEAWSSWMAYARNNGFDRAFKDKTSLSRALAKKGYATSPRRIDGKYCRVYTGFKIAEYSL